MNHPLAGPEPAVVLPPPGRYALLEGLATADALIDGAAGDDLMYLMMARSAAEGALRPEAWKRYAACYERERARGRRLREGRAEQDREEAAG